MSIPTNKFKVEDFPAQKDWIGKLFFVLNPFVTTVSSALNKNITFGDNIQGQEIALDITAGNVSFPLLFRNTLPARPVQLMSCNATEDGVPVVLLVAWTVDDQNRIAITDISLVKGGVVSALSSTRRYRSLLRLMP